MGEEEDFDFDALPPLGAAPGAAPARLEKRSGAADLHAILKQSFGYDSFRPLQEEIIRDALAGRDVFALLPTGGGKSLCYQLPALAEDGLTVVVSPLIALMKDQVDALQAAGIAATFLNSSLSPGEARTRFHGLYEKKYCLLYVSPERLVMPDFLDTLTRWNVKRFAIDEAHCISEWGHDFRPEYRQLEILREKFPGISCMALTATATTRVRGDIIKHLKLKDPGIYVASFNRPNLIYRVLGKEKPYDQLLNFVKKRHNDSGIVYCLSRRGADENALRLREDGIKAIAYHAGMEGPERAQAQELFLRDEVKIVCATIAFGMGINKSNVRFVVHYDLPKNIEGYYQETGRAGRDGLPSECLLLFSAGDAAKLTRFIDEMTDPHEQKIARTQLKRIIDYAETSGCRRSDLLKYFGETYLEGDCASCDNCLAPRPSYDGTVEAQKFLSCIYRIKQHGFGTGMKHLIDVLRGADTEKIRDWGHNTLSTYGIGKDKSAEEWQRIGRELLRLGLCAQADGKFPTLELTPAGAAALSKRSTVTLTRPATTEKAAKHTGEIVCDEELFERLRGVRRELADERRVPAYVIYPDSTLRWMARIYPQTQPEMLTISGVSENKNREFGRAFTAAVKDFLKAHPQRTFDSSEPEPLKEGRQSGGMNDTSALSYRMFCNEKSVAEIAQERKLSEDTIYTHLLSAAEAGKQHVTLARFADAQLLERIGAAFQKHGLDKINFVHGELGGKVPYGLLRLYRQLTPGGSEAAEVARGTIEQRKQELQTVLPNAYKPWTADEDERLLKMYGERKDIEAMMRELGRQSSAIEGRYLKLTNPEKAAAKSEELKAQRAAAPGNWTRDDDLLLRALVKSGKKLPQLELIMQRDVGSIQRRLKELGL